MLDGVPSAFPAFFGAGPSFSLPLPDPHPNPLPSLPLCTLFFSFSLELPSMNGFDFYNASSTVWMLRTKTYSQSRKIKNIV